MAVAVAVVMRGLAERAERTGDGAAAGLLAVLACLFRPRPFLVVATVGSALETPSRTESSESLCAGGAPSKSRKAAFWCGTTRLLRATFAAERLHTLIGSPTHPSSTRAY